jgi:hypothetical protein
MSTKRRRAVNIDTAIIERLKGEAITLGAKSHTALASKIFLGEASTISVAKMDGKSLGVSMREAVWLSLRERSQRLESSITSAAQAILLGGQDPLTPEEISQGEALAAEREAARALEPPKPKKPRVKAAKKEPSKPPENEGTGSAVSDYKQELTNQYEETPEEAEERKQRQALLSKGSPAETKTTHKSAMKELDPEEEEYLGGVYSL